MSEPLFTLLDAGRPVPMSVRIAGETVRLSAAAVRAAFGEAVTGPSDDDDIDLAELARRLDRPLALDVPARAAYLGVSAHQRGRRLASLEAPDFTLPDLEGRRHSLAEHRGKKVFLVAYASW